MGQWDMWLLLCVLVLLPTGNAVWAKKTKPGEKCMSGPKGVCEPETGATEDIQSLAKGLPTSSPPPVSSVTASFAFSPVSWQNIHIFMHFYFSPFFSSLWYPAKRPDFYYDILMLNKYAALFVPFCQALHVPFNAQSRWLTLRSDKDGYKITQTFSASLTHDLSASLWLELWPKNWEIHFVNCYIAVFELGLLYLQYLNCTIHSLSLVITVNVF